MHPKNIRANLAAASLVVIATCLAGPHVIRAGKSLWDYPVRVGFLRAQEDCLNRHTHLIGKGAPFYETTDYYYPTWGLWTDLYEKCIKSEKIPAELLIEQQKYFDSKPANPYANYKTNWLAEFMWFLRDPIDTIYWWAKSFD